MFFIAKTTISYLWASRSILWAIVTLLVFLTSCDACATNRRRILDEEEALCKLATYLSLCEDKENKNVSNSLELKARKPEKEEVTFTQEDTDLHDDLLESFTPRTHKKIVTLVNNEQNDPKSYWAYISIASAIKEIMASIDQEINLIDSDLGIEIASDQGCIDNLKMILDQPEKYQEHNFLSKQQILLKIEEYETSLAKLEERKQNLLKVHKIVATPDKEQIVSYAQKRFNMKKEVADKAYDLLMGDES